MATIELGCPKCGITMQLDAAFAGGVARCSECGTMMSVPAGAPSRGSRGGRPSRPRPQAPASPAPQAPAPGSGGTGGSNQPPVWPHDAADELAALAAAGSPVDALGSGWSSPVADGTAGGSGVGPTLDAEEVVMAEPDWDESPLPPMGVRSGAGPAGASPGSGANQPGSRGVRPGAAASGADLAQGKHEGANQAGAILGGANLGGANPVGSKLGGGAMGLSEAVSRQMALTDRMSAATHVLPPDAGLAPTGVTSPPVGSEPLTPEAGASSPSGGAPQRNERVDSAPLPPRGGVPQPGVGADSDSRGLAGREQNDGRAMPEVRIEMESLVAAIPESPRPAAAPPTESDRLAVVPLGRAGPSRSRSTRPHTPQASARGGSASVRAEATQRRPAPLPKSTLRLVLVTLALGVLLAGGAAILAVMKTRSRAGGGGGDAAAEVNPFLAKEFNFLSLPVSPKLTLIVDGFSKLPSQSEALVAGAKGLGTGVTVQVIALTDDAPRAFPDPPRWLRPQDADELGKFLAGHRSSFAPGAERVDEAFALAVKGKPAQVVLITDQALDPDGLSKAEEHLGAIKGVRFDVLSTRPDENVKGMCQRLGGAFVLLKADTLSRWLNEAAAAAPAPGNAPAPAPGTAPAPAPGTAPAPKPGK